MNSEREKEWIAETAKAIKGAGFRVFLAERGTYGFFTDKDGSRVVSFQLDLLRTTFSGNYTTDTPRQTGTGWRIADNDSGNYAEMFDACPPSWAVGSSKWKFTTLEKHTKTYQDSSKYTELA